MTNFLTFCNDNFLNGILAQQVDSALTVLCVDIEPGINLYFCKGNLSRNIEMSLGEVTVINLTNSPINTAIGAIFSYNWRNHISPGEYAVLEAGGIGTLSANWWAGSKSEYSVDGLGIGSFVVGTALAVAGLVLAIPTGGGSLTLTLAVGVAVTGLSLEIGVISVAVKDFINAPDNKPGVILGERTIYVVEGKLNLTKSADQGSVILEGETEELKLRKIGSEEFSRLQKDQKIIPMDRVYPVGHGAKTKSTPFVTPDGWVWFQDPNNALMKMRRDGSTEPQRMGGSGELYISSPPVVSGDWVYFLGLNGALMRMKTDGSNESFLGSNFGQNGFAPVISYIWGEEVWYIGTNGALMWTTADGLGGANPGDVRVSSPPSIMASSRFIYFLGTNGALMRMKDDGTEGTLVGDNKGKTSGPAPSVDEDGMVWFWGTNGAVMKTNVDGTSGGNPGKAYSRSSPVVHAGWVYYQGLNDDLMCMKTDGSAGANLVGIHATIKSTPFVAQDQWLFFQGKDNLLMRACFHRSPQIKSE